MKDGLGAVSICGLGDTVPKKWVASYICFTLLRRNSDGWSALGPFWTYVGDRMMLSPAFMQLGRCSSMHIL